MGRAAILLVVAAIALSGCAGVPGGGETPTANSSTSTGSTPTATSAGAQIDESSYPDGATADGLDSETIASGHVDVLRTAGNFTERRKVDISTGGETSETSREAQYDLDANTYTATLTTSVIQEVTMNTYHDGETGFTVTKTGGETTYGRAAAATSARNYLNRTTHTQIAGIIKQFEFTATSTEERDGSVLITYESTGVVSSDTGSAGLRVGELAENSSAKIVVDESGVVRSVFVTANAKDGTSTTLIVITTDIGSTTVERPGWVDAAASRTTPVPSGL